MEKFCQVVQIPLWGYDQSHSKISDSKRFQGLHKNMINTLILIMKRFIYVAKCQETIPNFSQFVALINHTVKVERCIASQNNKSAVHNKKWKPYYE